MKNLIYIATFILLMTTAVNSTLAQNRGRQIINGLGRFEPRAASNRAPVKTSGKSVESPESPGALDVTFGTGGKTTTALPDYDEPRTMTIQPDGKILVTGYASNANGSTLNTYVIRYNANGSLDTGFAGGGVFRIADFDDSGIYDAAATPDGKILIAADKFNQTRGKYDFAVYRLNQNGTPDTTFGMNGIVTAAISTDDNFNTFGFILQPDGKIVVVGETRRANSQTMDVGVVRFNADGALDQTFGTNGKQVVQVLSQVDFSQVRKAALQPNGKIVLLGDNIFGGLFIEKVFLVRLNANGMPDNAFGTNGILLSDFNNPGGASNAADLAIQTDGKILASGFNYNASGNFIGSTLARYNQNGTNDTTFGANGAVFTDINTDENFGGSMLALPNSKTMQGGSVFNSDRSQFRFALRRLNADGTRDTTFGANGVVSAAWGVFSFGYETALQPDGKIISVGAFYNAESEPYDLGLARFLPDTPAPPPFFDFDGDGRADVSVFRSGTWYRLNSLDNSFSGAQFGAATDRIVPADYDGDARSDLAVFRSGVWYILQSSTNSVRAVTFGQAGDVPVPGDYDGDGRADLAVFRGGNWYILNSQNNSFRAELFGNSTDKPIVGDFDADGRQDLAVFRSGTWYVNGSTAGFYAAQFGLASDKPVAADYDGDGKTDLAVFRGGDWYISQSSNIQFRAVSFGFASDVPVAADYDGDGRADVAVFRSGNWFISNSGNNSVRAVSFGAATDAPVQTAYLP